MTKHLGLTVALAVFTVLTIGMVSVNAAPPAPIKLMEANTVKILKSAVASEIINREPVGESDSFSSDVGTLWCYTKIQNANGQAITHRWYFNDELMAAVALEIKADTYRTRSSKKILPYWKGQWRVEVVSENGLVLDTIKFTIK